MPCPSSTQIGYNFHPLNVSFSNKIWSFLKSNLWKRFLGDAPEVGGFLGTILWQSQLGKYCSAEASLILQRPVSQDCNIKTSPLDIQTREHHWHKIKKEIFSFNMKTTIRRAAIWVWNNFKTFPSCLVLEFKHLSPSRPQKTWSKLVSYLNKSLNAW